MTTKKTDKVPAKVLVMQDELNPVPVEIIAASIVRIDKAAHELRTSGLTMKCLIVLIHSMIPTTVTKTQISCVLEALSDLKSQYAPNAKA